MTFCNGYLCILCGTYLKVDKSYCDSGHPISSSQDYIPTVFLQDFTEMTLEISKLFSDDPLDMDETQHLANIIYRFIGIQLDIWDKHRTEFQTLFEKNVVTEFVAKYRTR